MVDLQGAYIRTAAGLEEIRTRAHGLTPAQRNLLILLDGKSALATFGSTLGCTGEQLRGLAAPLALGGLIAASTRQPPATGGLEVISAQTLTFLAKEIFGSGAGPILRKLEKAGASPAELLVAAEGAARLAKLTIDETKAQEFLAEVRLLIP